MQIIKVDFALTRLCRAYANERISKALYRRQRAELISYVQIPQSPFPDLVLNEYSQAIDDVFVPEETSAIDDLGFSDDWLNESSPTRIQTYDSRQGQFFNDSDSLGAEFDPELRENSIYNFSILSLLDRYYWAVLAVFLGIMTTLFLIV